MNKVLLRIGFADDDLDDHLLFFKAIKNKYSVPIIDCFTDTEDILNFYSQKGSIAPHILFLDKNMPGNYNYEGLIKVKNHPLLSQVPVVIYSTSENEQEIKSALQKGAVLFITKPVTFQQTVECLCNAIEQFVSVNIQSQ